MDNTQQPLTSTGFFGTPLPFLFEVICFAETFPFGIVFGFSVDERDFDSAVSRVNAHMAAVLQRNRSWTHSEPYQVRVISDDALTTIYPIR